MSARRRARVGKRDSSGVPDVLREKGLGDALWRDINAVDAWCDARGLPRPLEAFGPYPRCLRDHVVDQWVRREFPHPKFPKLPDWVAASEAGVPPPKPRIRLQARAKFSGLETAWSYSSILDDEEDPRSILRRD